MRKDQLIRLNTSSYLSISEVEVITLLYKPLIKEKAAIIYLSLFSLLKKNNLEITLTYEKLLNILGLSEEEFNKSKDILEAISLISSYEGEEDYLMLLKAPLTPKQFLSDGVLGLYLYSEIKEEAFKELQKLFELPKIDKTKYKEVSKTFDQCFKSKDASITQSPNYLVDKKINKGVIINNPNFDFDLFANSISTSFLSGKRITNKFQTFITNIAYTYMFDEKEMSDIYVSSLNESGYFDYNLCSKNARSKYRQLHDNKLPEITLKEEEKDNNLEEIFINIPIKELMKSGLKAGDITQADLEKVEKLYLNFPEVSRSIINVSVCYSINKCDGEVPPYQYFEKVLNSWLNKGVKTFEGAIKMTESAKENKRMKKNQKEEPDWLVEYQKHFEEGVVDL